MMSIVTISKVSYSRGTEIAEKVAEQLGYECVSREVLIEASEDFDVPEVKLLHAFRDAPLFRDRFTFRKEIYIAYVQAALLAHLQKNNVVYHGLAGHYLVRGVSHVLKVRIIDSIEARVRSLMEREEVFQQAVIAMTGAPGLDLEGLEKRRGVSEDEALHILEESDKARRQWGLHLYGIDTNDPSQYDLVVHIHKLSAGDAADLICTAARSESLQATAESQQSLDDLLLGARVKARLIKQYPRVNVLAKAGDVYVGLEGGSDSDRKAILEAAREIPGVRKIDMNVYPFTTVY
jgi:cytidylate kinase